MSEYLFIFDYSTGAVFKHLIEDSYIDNYTDYVNNLCEHHNLRLEDCEWITTTDDEIIEI